jgi:hypothetical protein
MVKRLEKTSSSHELRGRWHLSTWNDGTRYVIAYVSGADLLVKHSTNPLTIKAGGTLVYTGSNMFGASGGTPQPNFAFRLENGTFHLGYFRDDGANSNTFIYTFSNDITSSQLTDNEDEATVGEDLFQITDAAAIDKNILDCYDISGTGYVVIGDETGDDAVRAYELTTFSEQANISTGGTSIKGTTGNLNDDLDTYYLAVDDTADTWLYSFNGTAFTQVEKITTDSATFNYVIGQTPGPILLTKGNWWIFASVTAMYTKLDPNGSWSKLTFGGTWAYTVVSWEENTKNPEPRFLQLGGTLDDIYYFTKAGYPFTIDRNATSTFETGVGKWFYPYTVEPQTYIPANRLPIAGGHLTYQTLEVLHVGTEYVKGDGIVLYKDDDTPIGEFVIRPKDGIQNIGTSMQRIFFVSPLMYDLIEKVTYTFTAQQVDEMMTTDIANLRYGNLGTIDVVAGDHDYNCNQIPRWQFWKDMGELGLKRIAVEDDGKINMEDADVSSGITVTKYLKVPKIQAQGAGVNRVTVIGGPKPDGTGLAKGSFDIPTGADQQINEVIFAHPNRLTDALCLTDATNLANNLDTALLSYNFIMFGEGKALEGTTVSFAYAPQSVGATNVIVENYTYFAKTDVQRITALSALHWKGITDKQLLEATRANLNQLVVDVGNITAAGTTWYLDDTNSDIGGYESLNLNYDGDGEVDYSVASAVDGEAIEEFATAVGEPGITELLAGQYSVHMHASKTGGVQNIAIYFEMYKRAHPGGGETLLGTSHPTDIFAGADNSLTTHIHLGDTMVLATDRIVLKFKASVSGFGNAPSFDMHIQGDTTSRFQFPFALTGGVTPYVLRAGDTMTGDLTIETTNALTSVSIRANGGIGTEDVQLTLDAEDDSRIVFQENSGNRVQINYDAGLNQNRFFLYQVGDHWMWSEAGTEKMRLSAILLQISHTGVNSFVKFINATDDMNLNINCGAGENSVLRWLEDSNDRFQIYVSGDNKAHINIMTDDDMLFEVQDAEKMRLDATRLDISTTFLQLPVKTTTGDPGGPANGDTYVNTFDNKIRTYADGAWRDLATW